MGDVTQAKHEDEEIDSAMQPVHMPLPKSKPPAKGQRNISVGKAPTTTDILDAETPDMTNASRQDLLESTKEIVGTIFNDIFLYELEALKGKLAQPAPTPSTPLALTLIGGLVEQIATAAVGFVGASAAKALCRQFGGNEKTYTDAASTLSKSSGKAVAGRFEKAGSSPRRDDQTPDDATGESLIDVFVSKQRLCLLGKRHDAMDTLRVVASSALDSGVDLNALNGALRGFITRPLRNWFVHKITIEWMNLCARLSLGPRQAGQATDMLGANTIGGIHENGEAGVNAWRGAHEGFVDVTFHCSGRTPVFERARVSGGPGVLSLIKSASGDTDEHGLNLTLRTLPVYRRIWIRTGATKLDVNPAFVITPEGALEINYDDPALQWIGGAEHSPTTASLGSKRFSAGEQLDPTASFERATDATYAMLGANKVVGWLGRHSSAELK